MNPTEFTHPEDAAALRQMEVIPGFPQMVKKVLAVGIEPMVYGINMASSIRLSEKQLPKIYLHLPPICEKLGIPEPELYLQMNPIPNAWTSGDTRIWITLTSGLVEMMSDEELDAILAHECGHILCRHVLYHTLAQWLSQGLALNGLLDKLTTPAQVALLYWQRKSELSADRASAFITSPKVVAQVMARLSGGSHNLTKDIDLDEWARQADQYNEIRNDGIWNKTLQLAVTIPLSHPFAAVRVREILNWENTQQYQSLMRKKELKDQNICPNCQNPIESKWTYCKHCGARLV